MHPAKITLLEMRKTASSFGPFLYKVGEQPFKLRKRMQVPHGLPFYEE